MFIETSNDILLTQEVSIPLIIIETKTNQVWKHSSTSSTPRITSQLDLINKDISDSYSMETVVISERIAEHLKVRLEFSVIPSQEDKVSLI